MIYFFTVLIIDDKSGGVKRLERILRYFFKSVKFPEEFLFFRVKSFDKYRKM